jgi:hypothetical protein
MKHIFTTLFCLTFAAFLHAGIRFNLGEDSRKWVPQAPLTNNDTATRFVINGDSIKAWKEMVSLEFADSNLTLQKYVDTWKDGLRKTDPKMDIKEEAVGDGSIIVTYTSHSADEICIYRFFKEGGGVEMLTYHVRPKFKNDETFEIWEGIIRGAISIPNVKTYEIA